MTSKCYILRLDPVLKGKTRYEGQNWAKGQHWLWAVDQITVLNQCYINRC